MCALLGPHLESISLEKTYVSLNLPKPSELHKDHNIPTVRKRISILIRLDIGVFIPFYFGPMSVLVEQYWPKQFCGGLNLFYHYGPIFHALWEFVQKLPAAHMLHDSAARFKMLGWNIGYDFNDSDFDICRLGRTTGNRSPVKGSFMRKVQEGRLRRPLLGPLGVL